MRSSTRHGRQHTQKRQDLRTGDRTPRGATDAPACYFIAVRRAVSASSHHDRSGRGRLSTVRVARERARARGVRLGGISAGLLLATLLPRPALASGLNIEKLRLGPREDGVSASVDLSFAYGQGNINLIDLGTDGSFAYRKQRHLVFLLGASNFSTRTKNEDGQGVAQLVDKDSIFIDKHYAHLRYNYRLEPWVTMEVFTQVQADEFLLVQVRTKHGVGPRFTPYENDQFGVRVGVQYMFDHEQLDEGRLLVAPRGSALSFAHRNSSYFTMSLEVDRFAAQTTTYVQPRLDDPRDVQLLHETEFSIDITKYFALKLGMNLRWDSRPPVYCADRLGAAGACPSAKVVRVQNYDLAFRNSFSFSF